MCLMKKQLRLITRKDKKKMKSTEQDLKEFDKYVAITVHELCKAIDEINKAEEIINTEHCAEIQMREPTYLFNGT